MIKKVVRRQPNSESCFVCGRENNISMMADFFELEDDTVVGFVTAGDEFQSFPGVVHGGVVTALLDEIAGRAHMPTQPDVISMTVEINVLFKKPVPCGAPLVLTGRVLDNGPKIITAEGSIILSDGQVAATAEGKYFKLSKQRLDAMGAGEGLMKLYAREDDPTEIEIPEKGN